MLIIGYRQFTKRGFWLTIYGTCMLSLFLSLFESLGHIIPPLPNDMIIASIGMGVLIGTGLGIIFNAGGTTGGVDIIAKIIKDKLGIPMARTMFTFDAIVIGISLVIFLSFTNAIYTILGLYIASKLSNAFKKDFKRDIKSSLSQMPTKILPMPSIKKCLEELLLFMEWVLTIKPKKQLF